MVVTLSSSVLIVSSNPSNWLHRVDFSETSPSLRGLGATHPMPLAKRTLVVHEQVEVVVKVRLRRARACHLVRPNKTIYPGKSNRITIAETTYSPNATLIGGPANDQLSITTADLAWHETRVASHRTHWHVKPYSPRRQSPDDIHSQQLPGGQLVVLILSRDCPGCVTPTWLFKLTQDARA